MIAYHTAQGNSTQTIQLYTCELFVQTIQLYTGHSILQRFKVNLDFQYIALLGFIVVLNKFLTNLLSKSSPSLKGHLPSLQ